MSIVVVTSEGGSGKKKILSNKPDDNMGRVRPSEQQILLSLTTFLFHVEPFTAPSTLQHYILKH